MPSGSAAGSASTITSRSPSITTACRTSCSARRSRRASPLQQSRSFIAANGSPVIAAACARIGRPLSPSTCPAPTGAIATGPTSASAMRPKRSALTPAVLVDVILRSRPHPEQGFRSCVGILRLVKRYGAERVDAACARALVLGTRSYTSVAAILKNCRERAPSSAAELPLLIHENIRGPDYYH